MNFKTWLLNESEQKVIIYPRFIGSDNADNVNDGIKENLNVKDCLGNEPDKDFNYFKNEKKDYITNIVKTVKEKGINALPPIKAIKHPILSGKYLVVDGNHRLASYKIGNLPQISTIILNENDISLVVPLDAEYKINVIPKTIPLSDAKKNNIDLKNYFTTRDLIVPPNDPWVISLNR